MDESTLWKVIILSTLILQGISEYLICRFTKRKILRRLPMVWPLFWAVLAVCCIVLRWGNAGWLDLSAFFALIFGVYALLSVVSLGIGYLAYRYTGKRNDPKGEDI